MAKKKRKTARKKLPSEFPSVDSTPAERVTWLLEKIWDGNRSEMGRAVGCSHSVLTKIATGQQGPGARLLSDIASHPKVNPAWLLAGEGEPLLAERTDSPAEGWPIPVARQLLLGPPDENRSLLSGEFFPAAGAYYRPSRYWLEVQRADPIARDKTSKITEGDLLLMETDPAWRREHGMVEDRLCGVQMKKGKEIQATLGLIVVEWPAPDGFFGVQTFEKRIDPKDMIEETIVSRYPDGKLAVRRRLLRQVSVEGRKTTRRLSNLLLAPNVVPIELAGIFAVCMMVVRRQPLFW